MRTIKPVNAVQCNSNDLITRENAGEILLDCAACKDNQRCNRTDQRLDEHFHEWTV